MSDSTANNSIVAVFNTHTDAEEAIKKLQQSGFDMKNLSIIARDYQAEENVVGYYNTGDRVKYWGKLGAFLGRFLGIALWLGIFHYPRNWPHRGGWPAGNVDRRGTRRRSGFGWAQRRWCRALQHRYSKR
jgi:hypothetical protein